jgi:hypothetical protein
MHSRLFEHSKPKPGVQIHGTRTRLEYTQYDGASLKRKGRLCARGDQQVEGANLTSYDLYAPTLKVSESRLLVAIAPEPFCPLLKSDTRQAFLYGEIGEEEQLPVHIRPPDWLSEPIPEGHGLLLLKSMNGTKQAARRWHIHFSEWMEKNGLPAVNSDKSIIMKRH